MDFDSAQPIWQQLVADFTRRIINGEWKPELKIPSTRELALEYKVNPNTVQRALSGLDRLGITKSERTFGRFVTEEGGSVEALRKQAAQEIVADTADRLKDIGITQDQAVQLLTEHWRIHD